MRLGFRRLLPVLFTVIYLLLLVAIEHQQQRPAASEVTVCFPCEPPEPSAADLAEIILYLPALIAAIPIMQIFNIRLSFAATPFVPVLWWLVGYWLDVRFGFVAAKPKRSSPIRTAGRVLAAIVSGLLLLLFLWATLDRHPWNPDWRWFKLAGVLWFGWMFTISVYRPRYREA